MKTVVLLALSLVLVLGHAVTVEAAKLRRGDRVVVDRDGSRFDGRQGTVVRVGARRRVHVALDHTRRQRRMRPRPPRTRRWFSQRHVERVRRRPARRGDRAPSPERGVALPPTPAPPAVPWRTVSTAEELRTAVAGAPAGTAVEVQGGDFGHVTLNAERRDWVTVRPVAGARVTFAGLTFGRRAAYIRVQGVTVNEEVRLVEEGAHHIQLVGSRLRGVRAEWGTRDLLVEGNEIRDASTGVELISQNCDVHGAPEACSPSQSLPPVERVAIRNNRIIAPAKNGVTIANFRAVLMEGNEISGLVERGQHSDALQSMWGGAGLIVRRNLIRDMTGNQGLFIKDGRVANVTIEDNLIVRTGPRPGFNFSGPPLSFYDTVPDPAQPFYTGYGIRIVRNTVWDNAHYVMILGPDNRRIQIRHNVTEAVGIGETTRAQVREGGVDQDFNVIGSNRTWGRVGAHDVAGPPRFRDRDANDYRITDAQADAIGFRPGVTWAP